MTRCKRLLQTALLDSIHRFNQQNNGAEKRPDAWESRRGGTTANRCHGFPRRHKHALFETCHFTGAVSPELVRIDMEPFIVIDTKFVVNMFSGAVTGRIQQRNDMA